MDIMSRKEAIEKCEKFYFTGKPCKYGHVCQRYAEGGCVECKRIREQSQERKIYEQSDARRIRRKVWRHNYMKSYRANPENKKRKNEWTKERRRTDPVFRINANMSSSIRQDLRNNKCGNHWESVVNFTIQELMIHLEKRFDKNMTWDNYGSYWHIDHIKPLSLCSTFEEAWQLSNLQPLEAIENCTKGNRYIG